MAWLINIISFLKSLLSPPPSHRFTELTKLISYRFNNIDYLEQAFTHRSISSEPRKNYERLEFLGDAVIDIIISRGLMRYYPDGDEGLTCSHTNENHFLWRLSHIGTPLKQPNLRLREHPHRDLKR